MPNFSAWTLTGIPTVSAAAVSRWFGGDTLTRTGYDTGGVRGFGSTTVFAGKCPPPLCFQTLSAALSLWSSPSVFTLFSVPELVLCVCVCVCVNFVGSVSTAVLCVQVHFRTGTETSESCQRFFNQTWREKSEPWAEWETLGWIYDAQTFKILHLANLQLFCHFLDLPLNYRIFEPNLQSFLVKVLVVFDWFKTFCRQTHTTTVLLFCYVLAKIFFEATFC